MGSDILAPLSVLCLVILGTETIVSLLGNGLIIAVNGHSLLHNRKMVSCEILLTCLSISRLLLQAVLVISQLVYMSSRGNYAFSCITKIMDVTWVYSNMAMNTCDTCLYVFYFLKVTTFAHPLFLWLKSRTDRLVVRLLVMSCVASVAFSLPSVIVYLRQGTCHTLTGNLTKNKSQDVGELSSVILGPVLLSSVFIVCLAASVLLFISLWRHMRTLKKNGLDVKDLSTRAHLSVMKSLLFFLFSFVLYFVVMNIDISNVFPFGSPVQLLCIVLLSSYPSFHSILLILINPKLKEVCVWILNTGRGGNRTCS